MSKLREAYERLQNWSNLYLSDASNDVVDELCEIISIANAGEKEEILKLREEVEKLIELLLQERLKNDEKYQHSINDSHK